MPRKHTASFILELPLKTDSADAWPCAIILDAGRNAGNAVLGERLRRLDLMRKSRAYRAARKMSRGEPRPERKRRANEFKRLFEAFGFTGHALHKFAQGCRDKCWVRDHLPGHVGQTAATRAFNAILEYAFGKRGRPKFRRRDRYNSFESKKARSAIIWRDGAVPIAGRVIPAIPDPANAWQSEALKARTKYRRIIRRDIRSRERWYVQLVQKGLLRRVTKCGAVGPHIGPSTIAAVAHGVALAVLPVSSAPESGEAPRRSLWPSG
jgi:putative transposase